MCQSWMVGCFGVLPLCHEGEAIQGRPEGKDVKTDDKETGKICDRILD